MIVLFGVALLSILWVGLYYKVQSERQMEINSTYKEAGNLARSFEEHSSRTIKGADQTSLFLKYQYEKMGGEYRYFPVYRRRNAYRATLIVTRYHR
jgi:hypothetical protein